MQSPVCVLPGPLVEKRPMAVLGPPPTPPSYSATVPTGRGSAAPYSPPSEACWLCPGAFLSPDRGHWPCPMRRSKPGRVGTLISKGKTNFTPSRSKVSPLHPPTLPESHHRAMPLSPAPPWPPGHVGRPRPCTQGTTGIHLQRGSRGRLYSTCPSPATTLLQHIPTFYLKSKATHRLPDPPFSKENVALYSTSDDEHCVLCVL